LACHNKIDYEITLPLQITRMHTSLKQRQYMYTNI
jgi:hypothetical protein